MSEFTKSKDTSINTEAINTYLDSSYNNISAEQQCDLEKLNQHIEKNISPLLIPHIKKPESTKKGILSTLSNPVIDKIYQVIWNTLGDVILQQQHINKQLLARIDTLEQEISKYKDEN